MFKQSDFTLETINLFDGLLLVEQIETSDELSEGGLYKAPTQTSSKRHDIAVVKKTSSSVHEKGIRVGDVVLVLSNMGTVIELNGTHYKLLEESHVKGSFNVSK